MTTRLGAMRAAFLLVSTALTMASATPAAYAARAPQLTLAPSAVTLAAGASTVLTGRYANVSASVLAWRIEEGAAGGTLVKGAGSSGVQRMTYTAPSNPGVYHVRFYHTRDARYSALSLITVNAPPPVTVAITPASAVVAAGATQRFAASVTGSSNAAVTWTSSAGSIGADGVFTAPASAGSATVRATSVADPGKSATATVTVTNPLPTTGFSFREPFTWKGNHASTINHSNSTGEHDHAGTTVWWNEDAWDVVGDSSYLATAYSDFGAEIGKQTGFHVDVHKAASSDPANPAEDNGVTVVGGDGSAGVAAMRLDQQGVLSARLRNPMLISAERPGVVEFYAPRFVTTGHWWEVAITPVDKVIGGMNTSVPAQIGRRPFEDGLNVVVIGQNDVPCLTSWRIRYDVSRSIGGVETLLEEQHPLIEDYTATDPAEKDKLHHWKIEFRPSGVDLYADFTNSGAWVLQRHVDIAIPWPEVHAHLLGVAYQADHHPQGAACYQGKVRELNWRNVSVSPVKFARTSYAPRNGLTANVQRQTGWLGYDLRDIQRFGPDVHGAPQANLDAYSMYGAMAFGSVNLQWAGAPAPAASKELSVELDASQAAAAAAKLVYDIKGRGTVSLSVNGNLVGAIPNARSVAYYAAQAAAGDNLLGEYTHRAAAIPAGWLKAGVNKLRLTFTGEVALDRVHLEFGHAQ